MNAQSITEIVEKLKRDGMLGFDEFKLLMAADESGRERLRAAARECADKVYGKAVYIRGLIEFTNYCRNDCLYCGIRRSNQNADRYRLTNEQIMNCCEQGYGLGFRTFVLQGGEDAYFTDERVCGIVSEIKRQVSFEA